MVEKRVFDTMLANFLRNQSSVRITALVDKEGLPISFAIKSRRYKVKPKTLGALIKQAVYPLENYSANLDVKAPLCQVYLMEQGTLLILDLGVAVLCIIFDTYGWPLKKEVVLQLLRELKQKLSEAFEQEDGILSKITGVADSDATGDLLTDRKFSEFSALWDTFLKGSTSEFVIMDPAPAPEIFMKVAEKYNSFIADGKSNILSMNPNYGPEFVASTKETLDIEQSDFNALKSGKIICGISYYMDKTTIGNCRVGEYNGEDLFIFKKFDNWGNGFKRTISEFQAIANYLVADFASETSMNFIEIVTYLTEPAKILKEKINELVKNKDFNTARKFMKRAAILFVRNGQYLAAGDIYKWLGFILYKDGENRKAIPYYELAASNHNRANDYEKSGGDYMDIANIMQNRNKVSSALDYYNKALDEFQKADNSEMIQNVEQNKNELLAPYFSQVKTFINQSTSQTLTLDYLSKKFKLNDTLLINILQKLIQDNEITGEVDVDKGRYTKVRISGSRSRGSTGAKPEVKGSAVIGIDISDIQPQMNRIEALLRQKEKVFEQRGIPFMDYIDYEKLLDKKQFLEHRRRIAEEGDSFFDKSGRNQKCYICFKDFSSSDRLVQCGEGHKAHQKCMSVWVKSQDSCPVCESPLFPDILRLTTAKIRSSTGDQNQNMQMINELQTRISDLEDRLSRSKKKIQALQGIKGGDNDVMDKLIHERELKERLEKELKRKELTIRELKSMIKLFKQ